MGWWAGWRYAMGSQWGCWRRERAGRWSRPPARWGPQPSRSAQGPETSLWGAGLAGGAPGRQAPWRRWTRSPTCTGRMESPGREGWTGRVRITSLEERSMRGKSEEKEGRGEDKQSQQQNRRKTDIYRLIINKVYLEFRGELQIRRGEKRRERKGVEEKGGGQGRRTETWQIECLLFCSMCHV